MGVVEGVEFAFSRSALRMRDLLWIIHEATIKTKRKSPAATIEYVSKGSISWRWAISTVDVGGGPREGEVGEESLRSTRDLLGASASLAVGVIVERYLYPFSQPRERTSPDWIRKSSPSGREVGAVQVVVGVDLGNRLALEWIVRSLLRMYNKPRPSPTSTRGSATGGCLLSLDPRRPTQPRTLRGVRQSTKPPE